MGGSSLLLNCSKTPFNFFRNPSFPSSHHCYSTVTTQSHIVSFSFFKPNRNQEMKKNRSRKKNFMASSLRTSAFVVDKALDDSSPTNYKEMMPKIDKSGRFCSPRAARELAFCLFPFTFQFKKMKILNGFCWWCARLIIYAACLEGSDPIRLFEKRMNARREPGYEFDKASLLEYNHMSFGGPPVTTETVEEADELQLSDEKESAIEAEVLSAPPKLVYSKLLLRFTRKLLVAVVDKWDSHVLVIDKVSPPNWKNEPAGRILEFCILHMAMSEITVLGTRHQIVINEAVDLAKRFCDGAGPRIINGCLRTFLKDLSGASVAQTSDANEKVEV
ncbi:hypothetical protein POTOM_014758 [Populus tomentosa]|uniref:NusB/RsmB/TIM44 domain-containing protein n=1 Tax=Populus tomentosa TaxID=118781 RepID=A0A8X8A2L4_POPTO|nr:hypothetical protein POTOM_014758 [Populus tomentosa]